MNHFLVILGSGISLIGGIGYVIDTLKGTTKPNRVTWLLWSIAPMISTVAALVDGVTWAVLPVFVAGITPIMILLASFVNKNAYWELHALDYILGILSALALILWWITDEPVVAIALSILADGLAAIPSIIKSWKYPDTESGLVFVLSLFSVVTGLMVVKEWVFAEYGFLIYLTMINLIFIYAIYHKRIYAYLNI